ncbi:MULTISPECIES: hypothetical protein [unclassified Wolbachia]|uniref:hypothetical protein n=1 Tax=unclassified Wolbachia TaxID=2640676 RepID=UPI000A893463|nr:hypothetical protein [Wolbachia endosymbiont of Nomada panzeri]MDX5496346.1 hypothetical protein [Wolbachia endosymbiont of Nomada fabriciana]MDX5527535.1 hypothetical protein [Wolbachia endosymbiont of Andrena minutula]
MAKRQPSSRYLLAAEIPRMNRGMTVRGDMTISLVILARGAGIQTLTYMITEREFIR